MEELALKTIVYNIKLVQFEEVFHDEVFHGNGYTTIPTFNNQILHIQLYFSQFFLKCIGWDESSFLNYIISLHCW